ncbi:hypothetical protein [Cytobacillus sp. BC1816]|uniref:hypothetical protein n=1 Tax=Cytobacillus sp. BC1816 TaxID=3440154 RepID=UPI003F50DAEE
MSVLFFYFDQTFDWKLSPFKLPIVPGHLTKKTEPNPIRTAEAGIKSELPT